MNNRFSEFFKANYSVIAIMIVFFWSAWHIYSYRIQETPPGMITIRIGHWQLEGGVRDGLNEMAKEYQKLHPNVRVMQDAIPESVYGQWSTTQFMGGTAPDIMQMGLGVPYQQLLAFYNRYCIPLSSVADEPNPYNVGTEVEGVPLRKTYTDNMLAGFQFEMQEFMAVPLSRFAVRVFYNKDLLKKLTGSDTAPKDYREFLEVCAKIKSQLDPTGKPFIPIVGSKYHFGLWDNAMADIATYNLMRKGDFNRDGIVGNDEFYVAIKTNRISLDDKPIATKFKIIRDICDNCQPGFTGLTRDEGVFLFAQCRAVFITTGTWDAMSLVVQAQGKFEVGIMDFPVPSPQDAEFGDMYPAPRYESTATGFNFAVTRFSKHPEIAIDFLRFLASKKNNERLNQTIGWIPAIQNAEVGALLKNFRPSSEGIYSCMNPNLGGETWINFMQIYSLYQVNQISFPDFVKTFIPFYKTKGVYDFQEQQKDWRRGMMINETFLTGLRSMAMLEPDKAKSEASWRIYRILTRDRQVLPEIIYKQQMDMIENGFPADTPDPYEYSPNAIANLKKRILGSENNGGLK